MCARIFVCLIIIFKVFPSFSFVFWSLPKGEFLSSYSLTCFYSFLLPIMIRLERILFCISSLIFFFRYFWNLESGKQKGFSTELSISQHSNPLFSSSLGIHFWEKNKNIMSRNVNNLTRGKTKKLVRFLPRFWFPLPFFSTLDFTRYKQDQSSFSA